MRITRQIAFTLGAFLACSACAAEPGIAQLSWLSGCWASEGGEPGSGEHWMPPAGETMFGTSRTVMRGKTIEFEFMELRTMPDGKLAFIAHPSGKDATIFPALQVGDPEAVFENLQHDFPQRVAYVREGNSRLRARIEGMREGVLRVIEFPMIRVACGSRADGAY